MYHLVITVCYNNNDPLATVLVGAVGFYVVMMTAGHHILASFENVSY